jgi:transcription elongation factor GreA
MAKETIVTSEGLRKLELELEELKSVKRKDVAEKIKTALSFGDLSENSEYDEAKNEQAMIEGRIAELEAQLKYTRVLDEAELRSGAVHVGLGVVVRNEESGEEENYRLVGSVESDPLAGKISDESPVGKALMGHVAGDTVEVTLPNGSLLHYTLLEIVK